MEIEFKATLVGKSFVSSPLGEKGIKIELAETKSMPPPVFMSKEKDELAQQVLPIMQQVIEAMPFISKAKIEIKRLTLWLTEQEWEQLYPKPELGDEITVKISAKKIEINPE